MIVFATSLSSVYTVKPPVAASSSTGVFIPLYVYPGTAWQTVARIKKEHPSVPILAVINPDSGPGTSKDLNYVSGIDGLRAAGALVVGYVYTSYGSKSIGAVEADISSYHSWYTIDGILFDEMSNVPGNEAYYSNISQYAKSLGYTYTVGNPGSACPSSFFGTVDNLVIYEDAGLPPISYLQSYSASPKGYFSVVAYSVSPLNLSWVRSAANYVHWIGVTDAGLPNPYNTLPPYLSSLVAALSSSAPSTPPAQVTVTVNSADLSGNPLPGMPVMVTEDGGSIASGATPLSFGAAQGSNYTITTGNLGPNVFDHWSVGSTSASVTVTPAQATTLTAYFNFSRPHGRR